MEQLQNEFEAFFSDLEKRFTDLNLRLDTYLIDHIGYRVETDEEYESFGKVLKEASTLFMKAPYHGRDIFCFFLTAPLVYKNTIVHCLEFAQPGGSDTYTTGFQHIEILLTKKDEEALLASPMLSPLLFKGKFGDEIYLKWPDKIAVKVRELPLLGKFLTEDNLEVTFNKK